MYHLTVDSVWRTWRGKQDKHVWHTGFHYDVLICSLNIVSCTANLWTLIWIWRIKINIAYVPFSSRDLILHIKKAKKISDAGKKGKTYITVSFCYVTRIHTIILHTYCIITVSLRLYMFYSKSSSRTISLDIFY